MDPYPQRITATFLDVVEYLATHPGAHGYAIYRATRNRPATVYAVLARLVAADWVHVGWPRRCISYELTEHARDQVEALLAARRPTPTQFIDQAA